MNRERLANLLFERARNTTEGCIVELGTFHGKGTIWLCRGARAGSNPEVITIDDYVERVAWTGESYLPENKQIFQANIKKAGVDPILLHMDIDDAIIGWEKPIGLWSYEIGQAGRFLSDWKKWSPHIILGGHAIMRENKNRDFGIAENIPWIVGTGEYESILSEGGVTVLKKIRKGAIK